VKRALFIASDLLCLGGISRFNQNLVHALCRDGWVLDIISRNDVANAGNGLCVRGHGRIRPMWLRKSVFVLRALWEGIVRRPDVLVCGHANFAFLCWLISRLIGRPYIVIAHGVEVWDLPAGLRRWGLAQANCAAAVSHFTACRLEERLPSLRDRIVWLPNTVDSERFRPAPRPSYLVNRYGLDLETKVILTVARFDAAEVYKGYDRVVDVLPSILAEVGKVRYLLVGCGSDVTRIREEVQSLDLTAHVTFCGFVPDEELVDHYNLCDLYVMPSIKEGFGIVFLEALACGKPVVAGNRDGSVDAVLGGDVGFLVDPTDGRQIAKAIGAVLTGRAPGRLSDGPYLRRTIVAAYGMPRFCERVSECFARFVGQTHSTSRSCMN
jgi:glycosyltransferase involved in cell wall biosynthesis